MEYTKGGIQMIKNLIRKAIESYAKASTTSSVIFFWHTPVAPRSLISK